MKRFRIKSLLAIVFVISFSLLFTVSCSGESEKMKNAKTCMGLEQYDEALANLKEEIKDNPGNEEAYLLQGEAFALLMKEEDANSAFNTALKINAKSGPRIAETCIRLARKINNPQYSPKLLIFASQKDATQKEAIKLCLEDLGKIAINDGKLQFAFFYFATRAKYGEEKNPEFAELFYNFSKKNAKAKKDALDAACYFDKKYGKEYAAYLIEISQKLWEYRGALTGINRAIRYDPQYKPERNKLYSRFLKSGIYKINKKYIYPGQQRLLALHNGSNGGKYNSYVQRGMNGKINVAAERMSVKIPTTGKLITFKSSQDFQVFVPGHRKAVLYASKNGQAQVKKLSGYYDVIIINLNKKAITVNIEVD